MATAVGGTHPTGMHSLPEEMAPYPPPPHIRYCSRTYLASREETHSSILLQLRLETSKCPLVHCFDKFRWRSVRHERFITLKEFGREGGAHVPRVPP